MKGEKAAAVGKDEDDFQSLLKGKQVSGQCQPICQIKQRRGLGAGPETSSGGVSLGHSSSSPAGVWGRNKKQSMRQAGL